MSIENKYHVLRGGSWFSYQGRARASFRDLSSPHSRYDDLGFRVTLRRRYEHKK